MRFQIRTLMFYTAFVAVCIMILRDILTGPSVISILGFAVYAGLMMWSVHRTGPRPKSNDELVNKAREDGGENPTT